MCSLRRRIPLREGLIRLANLLGLGNGYPDAANEVRMNAMDPQGLNMTTPRSNTERRIPQLIPHRLLRNDQRHHPAVLEEAERRTDKIQLRLADHITAFAGSMNFVWIHAAIFRRVDDATGKEPLADIDFGGVT
jgi:hypothetical protein